MNDINDETGDPFARARQAITESVVSRGQIWRHYKGTLYTVLDVGINEATLEPVVIYVERNNEPPWIRTLSEFMGQGVIGVSRFVRVL
jgi:hypothetical protein